ncbi:MAG TPA: D-aminoacyl-tRNA deacylase [Solirubrobacteraceae bacterium]|nr:D-aminoacyl-tRNA deacylase [Solirubrobacteraceae bacterium]
MKAVVQRVSRAAVRVDAQTLAQIGPGLVVLLGVGHEDTAQTAERLAQKIRALRIFADENGRMNEPVKDREILCISQFTLYADTSKGNRPSFIQAAEPQRAATLYDLTCEALRAKRGRFAAHMEIELTADGPVTIVLEVT